jgi:hypothetical protein
MIYRCRTSGVVDIGNFWALQVHTAYGLGVMFFWVDTRGLAMIFGIVYTHLWANCEVRYQIGMIISY